MNMLELFLRLLKVYFGVFYGVSTYDFITYSAPKWQYQMIYFDPGQKYNFIFCFIICNNNA